jgi:glutathione S-transferase
MHPASITSRPIRLFIAEKGHDVDEEVVDLFSGARHQEPFVSINPAGLCLCSRTATSG